MKTQNEIEHMQIRLFQKAKERWRKRWEECADIFDSCQVDEYIEEVYELFHVQGDEANLDEIEMYLADRGVTV